jgi:methylglutaconyl-CoA hydratase
LRRREKEKGHAKTPRRECQIWLHEVGCRFEYASKQNSSRLCAFSCYDFGGLTLCVVHRFSNSATTTIVPETHILSSASEGVVRLTLNRPAKRNALTRELLAELLAQLKSLSARSDVRCLVLGANGPAFCAGMDLAQMEETAARPDAAQVWQTDTHLYHDVVIALFELPVPTLAVVQGPAVAGGLGLVLACDLVVAADSAGFALPEPKRGLTAAIVTPLLVYRAGAAGASFLLLSGELLDARSALRMGLCHSVVEPARLQAVADEQVRSILSGAPGALAITKQQLRACAAGDVAAQLKRAVGVSAQARETAEAREGLAAFLNKRPPKWQPK